MSGRYKESCMKFTNEELKKYLYDRFFEYPDLQIRCLSEDEVELDFDSSEKIETIVFDDKENIAIMFYGHQTSIFAYKEELMFIDESGRNVYTSSDVQGNAVYEGDLREMSHEEMLYMFSEIILCFIDATDISITQFDAPEGKYRKYKWYDPHLFVVDVTNDHIAKKSNVYENITINH